MRDPCHDYACLKQDLDFYHWCPTCVMAWLRIQCERKMILFDETFNPIDDLTVNLANEEDGWHSYTLTDDQVDEAAWHAALEDIQKEPPS